MNRGSAPPPSSSSGVSVPNPSQAVAEREQKMLDASTDALLIRMNDVRTSITGLIAKLENDPRLNWPSFLDSYALISGQLRGAIHQLLNIILQLRIQHYSSIKNSCFVTCVKSALCS
jgi:hypothetical protein